jgi:hypothetical protein
VPGQTTTPLKNPPQTGAAGDHVGGRALGAGQHGLGRAAVAGEGTEERVLVHQVGGGEAAGGAGRVVGQVVAAALEACSAARVAVVPGVAGHDRGAIPVKLQLLNATGGNLSAPGTVVTVTGPSPSPAPGKASAGTFTYMTFSQGPGYQLNVKTKGYPAGTYTLSFTAGSDLTTHTIQFVIS